jgi:hypothetical protein
MNAKRLLISFIATALLAIAATAPAAANDNLSCVGWFASTVAQEDAQEFAATISGQAHDARPFGFTTVAPFAHIALEDCQGDAE